MPHPGIDLSASLHLLLGSSDPACYIHAPRGLGQIIAVLDHPLLVLVTDESLEQLVVPNINRLCDASAAGQDDDDFDTPSSAH
jgi:hypothetical protein